MIISKIKRALGRQYLPLNTIEISAKKLRNNLYRLRSIDKNIKPAPVLKSNAYGHGLVETARILDSSGAPFFCVDSIYEAYKLLKSGIKTRILIMGYVNPINLRFKKLPFSFAVYDFDHLNGLLSQQPQARIHIFVDTGMGREGIPVGELEEFVSTIPEAQKSNIEGIMSHFAASEKPNDPRTKQQVANFKKAVSVFKRNGIFPEWVHMANSSGLLNIHKLKIDRFTNMARCGIALYGVDPEGKNKKLEPSAKLFTRIVQLKSVKKGGTVGYNFTFTAKKDMRTAVLPIGYNDGVDRDLSNGGLVFVNGAAYPIVGRVSMNVTIIDTTNVNKIKKGDRAEIVFSIASKNKIPYEFLVHLNPEIKRVII